MNFEANRQLVAASQRSFHNQKKWLIRTPSGNQNSYCSARFQGYSQQDYQTTETVSFIDMPRICPLSTEKCQKPECPNQLYVPEEPSTPLDV